jgi:hypothetical protein
MTAVDPNAPATPLPDTTPPTEPPPPETEEEGEKYDGGPIPETGDSDDFNENDGEQ